MEKFEDSLEYTFVGSDENLDSFMDQLKEIAKELAKEHNVEIE